MVKRRRNLNIIGMMSGTSMDAINVTFVSSNGILLKRHGINIISDYGKETKLLLKECLLDYNNFIKDISLNNYLTYLITFDHFKAVKKILKKTNLKPDLIGFHGQTVKHEPQKKISIQLGDSQLLCNFLKTKVISNFRDEDIISGGEGAPLAPIYHQLLIKELNFPLPSCFLNIGGISNLTFWDGHQLVGFDTGPGNCMMDSYMQKIFNLDYDDAGKLASTGKINLQIKDLFLKNTYFKKPYPKSLDKQEFNQIINLIYDMNIEPSDAMATLSECTFLSIFKAIQLLPKKPNNLIIMGGGVHNLYLLKKLKSIEGMNISTAEEKSIPGDFIEAELIAFLAARSVFKLPITFPNTTGVKSPLCGGKQYIQNNI